MDRPEKNKEAPKKKNTPPSQVNSPEDPLDLNQDQSNSLSAEEKPNPERLRIIEEISDLFCHEDIITAVKTFKSNSEEEKIAAEFANSHIQFLSQVVESDYKKGIARSDVEIRDLIANVNAMLMKKDEYLFTTVITHSPAHYRNIQKKFYAKIKKEEKA